MLLKVTVFSASMLRASSRTMFARVASLWQIRIL